MNKHKGVYYQKSLDKFKASCRANGKQITIGWYKTAEEASAAYIEFSSNVHRELSAEDNRKIKLYQDFAEFCDTPKFSVEYRKQFKDYSLTQIRNLLTMLTNLGCVSVEKISGGGQPKLRYRKLKSYDASIYVPRSRLQAIPKSEKPKEIEIKSQIIKGARVIKERHPTRVPIKSSRIWVSGSSLSMAI